MKYLNFKQVDVFPNEAFKGNPVAVIFDADELTVKQMKDIAKFKYKMYFAFKSKIWGLIWYIKLLFIDTVPYKFKIWKIIKIN